MNEPWYMRRMVAFDVETTGVDVEARIVSATVAYASGGLPTKTHTVLIDPGIEIPEGATAVHGITTERVRAEGASPGLALSAVLVALESMLSRGAALVVFNTPYDLTVLDREVRRHRLTPLGYAARVVDPLVLDRHLDRYAKTAASGGRTLENVCKHYGAPLDAAHDSASDAVAAARLAWVIGAKGKVKRRGRGDFEKADRDRLIRQWEEVRLDLPALHDAQAGWHADRAADLEDYFASQGRDVSIPRDWPLIPIESRVA